MLDSEESTGRTNPPATDIPVVVIWLLAVMLGVHFVRLIIPPSAEFWLVETLAFDSSVYTDATTLQAKPWALVTGVPGHMFIHADFLHLGLNAGMFLAFGSVIARRMAVGWFLLLFGVSGVAGAAGWFAIHPTSPALLIGASGAVSGCMGALTWLGLRGTTWTGKPTPLRTRRLAVYFAGIWIALNLVFGVLGGSAFGIDAEIAWEAHLAGFAGGFLFMPVVDGRGRVRENGDDIPTS